MVTTLKWLTETLATSFPRQKPTLSKRAQRRVECTSLVYEGSMRCRDGKVRPVRWLRFDVGRFLDRSKYNGDGSLK